MLRRRGPRPVAGAISGLRDAWAPDTALAGVQRSWEEVVGKRVAAAATPVSERGGVLTVACTDATWAHELDLMSDLFVSRLNEHLNGVVITRIRCRITP